MSSVFPSNLSSLLFDEGDPDHLLVHADGIDHSRAQVHGRATSISDALASSGIPTGRPIGVMLPNGADIVASLFGVWRFGGTYVPLNPRATADEVAHVVESVTPAAIITMDDHAARFEGLPTLVLERKLVRAARTEAVGPAGTSEPGVALIQFTSGTTGRPKAVKLEHGNVLDLLDGVLAKIRGGSTKRPSDGTPARPPMPNLVPVSLSLWAGIYQVLFASRVGAPVVVMESFDTKEFARLVDQFGIKSTVLPPAAMAMLADDQSLDSLAPLKYVRSITAALSPFQARRFRDRFGISVLNSYGQTELGGEIVGWNAADSREHGEDKLGSIGRPHQGVAMRAVDREGTEQPTDTAGELWVKTPSMSAGYADGTSLADRLSPDGWFRTGDVGRIDDDGFIWIEGRVSDMINRGGLKVFPAEVEEVLTSSPTLREAAVVGVPDDRLGEVPWAFVVPSKPGATVDVEALKELCRVHLAPYKVPLQFHSIEALPRNEVGKVLHRELASLVSATEPRTDHGGPTA